MPFGDNGGGEGTSADFTQNALKGSNLNVPNVFAVLFEMNPPPC